MAYTAYTWRDGAAGGTPIVASRLNALEGGLSTAASVADSAVTAAANAANAASSAASSASTASTTANAALTSAANAGTIASNLAATTYTKTQVDSLLATKAPLGSTTSSSGTGGGGAGGLTVVDMGDGTYEAVGSGKLLAGAGIDLTGVTVSTAGVQTFLDACVDGDTVVVPSGAIINLNGSVSLNHRLTLTGSGELRWTSGIAGTSALNVNVDGSVLHGLYLTTTVAPTQTGANKQYGICIRASMTRILGCNVSGLQQGIAVMPSGEYHDNIIANNVVRNVPGSGDGPTNTTSNAGEDRGDGIVNWGATCVITGNRVSAAAGADCRIGIHTEGLADANSANYAHADAMVTITGNVVTGQFRRGISCESVANTVITGNSVADSTWWSLSFINTDGCAISNNTVLWTRTTTDNQGAAWSPVRSGVMAYGRGASNIISGNTVTVKPGASIGMGISVLPDSGGSQDNLAITSNTLAVGPFYQGINLNGAASLINSPKITGNIIANVTNAAIYGWNVGDAEIVNNRLGGVFNTNSAQGVHLEQNSSMARVEGNAIFWTSTAILSYGRNNLSTYNNNLIYQATTGIDLFAAAGATVALNRFDSVGTKTTNLPASIVNIGNN